MSKSLFRILVTLVSLLGLTLGPVVLPAQAGKPGGGGGGSGGGTGINLKLQGFDALSKSWTPGNTAGYPEVSPPIPFRMSLTGSGTISTLQVLGDHLRDGVPGFRDMQNFRACDGSLTTGLPGANGCKSLADFGISVSRDNPDPVSAGVTQIGYTFKNITIPGSGILTLLWDAPLEIGSHNYPGSALHMAVGTATATNGTAISFGGKDVPIPVNAIIATETDKKIEGQDSYSATLGEIVDVTIAVETFGPAKGTQNLTITDDLPSCLKYVAGSASPAPASVPPAGAANDEVVWTLNNVKNDITTTVSFRAEVVAVGSCENLAVTTSNVAQPSEDRVPITAAGVPHITVTKSCTPTVAPGGTAQCTITYLNDGSAVAPDVEIRDVLDAGLTYVQVAGEPVPTDPTPDPDPNNGNKTTVVWEIGDVAVGEGDTITYGERVPATGPAGPQTFTDTATAYIGDKPSGGGGGTTTVTYAADLQVTKTCPGTLTPGTPGNASITYRNLGTAAATNTVVTDTLPSGMTLSNASPAPTSVNGNVVTWNVGTVPALSGDLTITFKLTVNSAGQFTNKADITSPQDPASGASGGNNTSSCTVGINYADVGIAKDCGGSAQPGDLATHTLSVRNTGNTASGQTTVTDTLPAGLTREGAPRLSGLPSATFGQTGQVMTWTFASLPAGTDGTIEYDVRVASTWTEAGPKTFTDAVTIAAPGAINAGSNDDSDTCSTTVNFQPLLTLTKTGCRETVVPGGYQTYALAWKNEGSAPATDVMLVDTPPDNQPITAAPGATISGNTATWDLGQVDPGEQGSQSLTVQVNAESGAVVSNSATISGGPNASFTAGDTTQVSSAGAATKADAFAIEAKPLLGIPLVPRTLSQSASSDPGGPASSGSGPVPTAISLGIVDAGLLSTTSTSEVGIGYAESTSTSKVAGLSLLGGAIKADAVTGVTKSVAGPLGASSSTLGSGFVNLRIGGQVIAVSEDQVNVELPNLIPGVTVKLKERVVHSELVDGKFVTRADINMIRVTINLTGTSIIVGHSHSEATYPTGLACGAAPNAVSGRAFTSFVDVAAGLAQVTVNLAEIPPYGGSDDANTAVASVPNVLSTGVTTNHAEGSVGTPPNARARSTVANLNLLNNLVKATALDVAAASETDGTPSTTFDTEFLGLVVGGTAIPVNPGPNLVIDLPYGGGLAHIVINEQFASSDANNTSGTVNAVHVQLFNVAQVLTTDVTVASAHSDAHRGS